MRLSQHMKLSHYSFRIHYTGHLFQFVQFFTDYKISAMDLNKDLTFYDVYTNVDTVEGVCNGFLALYTFFWFPEFSGYHQWQQESQ